MADDLTPTVAYPRPIEGPRNRFGWVALWVILIGLIVLQGISYFSRKPGLPLNAEEARLKFAVQSNSSGSLQSLIASLDAKRAKDENAERLWVIATHEAKQPVPAEDIRRLVNSKLSDGAVLGHIYEVQKMITPQVKSLDKVLTDDRFSTRLAKVHAREKQGTGNSGRSELQTQASGTAIVIIGLLIFGGIGLWIAFLSARATGNFQPEGHPAIPMSLGEADAFAMRAAQMLGIYILLPLIIGVTFTLIGPIPREIKVLASEIAILLGTLWLVTQPVDGVMIPLRRMGIHTDKLVRNILLGICAVPMNWVLMIPVMMASKFLFSGLPEPEHPITVELSNHPSVATILGLLFAASFVAPIFEESLFRGTFLPALSRVTRSPITGALITSLFFAMIHPTGIPAWPGLATLGAMSCLLAYQTRSLVPSMVMHALHNGLTLWITLAQ